MRRHWLPSFGVLLLALCPSEAVAETPPAPQLLEKSVTETMRLLLAEGHGEARDSLIHGFLKELPTHDYPEAFAALDRFEQRQTPAFLDLILELWASRDPSGAWKAVRPLMDIAIDGDHFVDEWNQKIIGPKNRRAFEASPRWREARHLLGFLRGLERAKTPAAEKARLRADFEMLYGERFGTEDLAPPRKPAPAVPAEPRAEPETSFARVKELLAAKLRAVPELLAAADVRQNHGALLWGLRRWITEDIAAAPIALEMFAQSSLRDADVEIVKAWARRDAKAAFAWFEKNRPEALLGFAGKGLIAYVDDKTRDALLRGPFDGADPDGKRSELYMAWAEVDPKRALHTALRRHGAQFYSGCAGGCFYAQRLPTHHRRVFEVIRSIPVPIEDEQATSIMEEMGDLDVGLAAQYGFEWILQVRASEGPKYQYGDKQRLIRVWSGQEDSIDSSMDDRTYGCLRAWAVFEPEEMRRWVERLNDPDFKRALQWMLTHPNGGAR
ncbi:MAG: hypothetical protein M3463_02105 [Verrucomicrobiota bacterium]|nr:hypothetical protein [Verrucomicrobiota bacterium]